MTRRVPLLAAVAAVALVALLADAGRNSGGTYSPPTGNPVVTGTTITSSWANGTIADIGTELTNSLDRYGRGAMLAALQLYAGSNTAPGLSFSSEPSSGIYRNASGDIRMSVLTNPVESWTTGGIAITGTASTTSLATLASLKVTGNVDSMTGIPTAANTSALNFTGTGSGAGAFLSGGADSGVGLVATGGAPNGNGITATGVGSGYGLRVSSSTGSAVYATALSGNTNAVSAFAAGTGSALYGVAAGSGGYGVNGQGGSSSGAVGVVGVGGPSTVGVQAANGTAATSGARTDALAILNGDVDFSATALPAPTTPLSAQRLTGNSFAKAWVSAAMPAHNLADANTGPNTLAILGGMGVTSVTDQFVNSACSIGVSGQSTQTVRITFATAFASTGFGLFSSLNPAPYLGEGSTVGWVCIKTSPSLVTCTYAVNCAQALSNHALGGYAQYIDVLAFGAQ